MFCLCVLRASWVPCTVLSMLQGLCRINLGQRHQVKCYPSFIGGTSAWVKYLLQALVANENVGYTANISSFAKYPPPHILEKGWDRWRVVGCKFPFRLVLLHSPCFSSPPCGFRDWTGVFSGLAVEKGSRVMVQLSLGWRAAVQSGLGVHLMGAI